jgi:hypothetical protein
VELSEGGFGAGLGLYHVDSLAYVSIVVARREIVALLFDRICRGLEWLAIEPWLPKSYRTSLLIRSGCIFHLRVDIDFKKVDQMSGIAVSQGVVAGVSPD